MLGLNQPYVRSQSNYVLKIPRNLNGPSLVFMSRRDVVAPFTRVQKVLSAAKPVQV